MAMSMPMTCAEYIANAPPRRAGIHLSCLFKALVDLSQGILQLLPDGLGTCEGIIVLLLLLLQVSKAILCLLPFQLLLIEVSLQGSLLVNSILEQQSVIVSNPGTDGDFDCSGFRLQVQMESTLKLPVSQSKQQDEPTAM